MPRSRRTKDCSGAMTSSVTMVPSAKVMRRSQEPSSRGVRMVLRAIFGAWPASRSETSRARASLVLLMVKGLLAAPQPLAWDIFALAFAIGRDQDDLARNEGRVRFFRSDHSSRTISLARRIASLIVYFRTYAWYVTSVFCLVWMNSFM